MRTLAASATAMAALPLLFSLPAHAEEIPFDVLHYMFFERAIERMVIVGFGGLSLVLGFRLFKLTAHNTSEMIAKGGNFSFQMTQVGPGVFFALFGAAILGYALYIAPTFDGISGSSQIRVSGAMVSSAVEPATAASTLRSLNQIEHLAQTGSLSDPAQKALFERASMDLEPLKRDLVDIALGEGRYDEWKRLRNERQINPGQFEATLRLNRDLARRFNDVDALLSDVGTQ